jgi:hypothetical protein
MRQSARSGPLVRFAWGRRRDCSAVVAAAETDRISGKVEGQINRLKTVKREMYGRAGFALLRAASAAGSALHRAESAIGCAECAEEPIRTWTERIMIDKVFVFLLFSPHFASLEGSVCQLSCGISERPSRLQY